MVVYKSYLDLFIINNNFSTSEWKNYSFLSLSCSASSLTSKIFLVAVDVTDVLTSSPNIPIYSSNYSTISTCIVFSFISIFITKKVCLFSIKTYISPKTFFTSSMISDITSEFLCGNFLSSTYKSMVHHVPSITLFATRLS